MRRRRPFAPCLTALALLLVSTTALAHEIEHDLAQHDEPACALHLLADHAGKSLLTAPHATPVRAYRPVTTSATADSSARIATTPFRARAPPNSLV